MGVRSGRWRKGLLVLALALGDAAAREEETASIQDNSFLLEEAYNQEDHVVQHISSFVGFHEGRDWVYAFTQEWPFTGQRHQIGFTVLLEDSGTEFIGGPGAGDLLLNYRFQVFGDGKARAAFAPRASLVVPTGDERRGRGDGALGFQVNLPLSLSLSPRFVAHSNAGATYIPSAQNEAGEKADTTTYNLGQSLIWLTRPRFNVMMEAAWLSFEEVTASGRTSRSSSLLLSPGVRWAFDRPSGLQIVPGVAIPVGFGASSGEYGLVLYLSFEHPFGRPAGGER